MRAKEPQAAGSSSLFGGSRGLTSAHVCGWQLCSSGTKERTGACPPCRVHTRPCAQTVSLDYSRSLFSGAQCVPSLKAAGALLCFLRTWRTVALIAPAVCDWFSPALPCLVISHPNHRRKAPCTVHEDRCTNHCCAYSLLIGAARGKLVKAGVSPPIIYKIRMHGICYDSIVIVTARPECLS